jgi:hypothetical protein
MKKMSIVVLVLLLAGMLVTACGGETTGEAKTAFCDNLKALDSSVATLKGMTPTSTVEEVQNAKKGVQDAWQKVADSAKNLTDVQINDVQQAYDQMMNNVGNITDEATVQQAVTAVQANVGAFQAKTQAITTTVCVTK